MTDLTQIREELFWVLLVEEICNFGVLQAPRPTAVGHSGESGAMPLPPGTIWVCDSDLEAPADGSSAGLRSHMCSELKAQGKARVIMLKNTTATEEYYNVCAPSIKYKGLLLILNGQQMI